MSVKFWGDDGRAILLPIRNRLAAYFYSLQLSPYGSMIIASPGTAPQN